MDKMNRRIIINADDFGRSENTNKSIKKAFDMNLISSATIMPNMCGFEQACEIIHNQKLFNQIGLHLNLTEGIPLSKKILNNNKFCNEKGEFIFNPIKGLFLSNNDKKVIYEELTLQILKCRSNNIILTHIDSHHHCHHYWGIGKIVIEIAKKYNIKSIRIANNIGNNLSTKRKLYSLIFNSLLKKNNFINTDYFCSMNSINDKIFKSNSIIEIMVHLILSKSNDIIEKDTKESLLILYNRYFKKETIISYSSLAKSYYV